MKKIKDTSVFDEFTKMCPWAVDRVKCWNPSDSFEIIVELNDGGVIQYDQILKTFRCAASMEELNAIRMPTNEEEWKQEFARRLYRKMRTKGYSQDDLSWDADISPASVTKYVNGAAVPSTYNMVKIAKALHLSVEDFAKLVCLV